VRSGESTPARPLRPTGKRPQLPLPPGFGGLPATAAGVARLIALSCSFGPSLRPAFPALFATTASADCSRALTRKLSPGKVHELSARAVRLYQMRLSVTVGFRVFSHAHRPHLGLSACSCSYGRAFAPDFFRAECLTAPALSFATVVVTVSEHFVSYV